MRNWIRALAEAALALAVTTGAAHSAPIGWVGPSNGFWDVPANWNPALPGVADDALLGAFDTTFRSGVVTIRSFTGTGTLTVSGGQLSVTDASSTGGFTLTGGTLGGAGTVTVTGAATLSGGTMSGAGRTILQGATALTALNLDAGRVLENRGTLTWSSGGVQLNSASAVGSGAIENAAGALFEATHTGSASMFASNFGPGDDGSAALFSNAGTFLKHTGVGTTTISSDFNNSGTVDVQTGTLSFTGTSTHTGLTAITTASGATLSFGNGSHSLDGVLASGAGRVLLSNGTLSVGASGATVASLFEMSGGRLLGPGNLTTTGAATLSGGTMSGAGRTILQGATALTALNLDAGRVLENRGTLTWSSGSVQLNSTSAVGSGAIENAAGALFEATHTGSASMFASNFGPGDDGSAALFSNAGTFLKHTGVGTTTISSDFNNSGTVDVQTGTLSFTGTSTHTGLTAITTASGATLSFGNGSHSLDGVLASGAGRVLLSNGTLSVGASGATVASLFEMSGGRLLGPGNLTTTGAATLSGGTMSGAGRTILEGATALTALNLDAGRVLENRGTLTWSSGSVQLNSTSAVGSGAIENAAGALFEVTGSANQSMSASNFGPGDDGSAALFSNAGTFRKSTGVGTTTISSGFNNSGLVQATSGVLSFTRGITGSTGTIQVDAAGAVTLGAPSSAGVLLHNGSGGTSLNLGANPITVFADYDNANFGVGDLFNRRANVSTSGTGNRLIAAGDANQGVSGAGVANGNTTTPSLVVGNVHVGATTLAYGIDNTGSTGPALRGAIQTGVNGANISDARLSGSGVTAGNWGPLATGASLARDVVLTVNSAGVYAPISGQAVSIVNNFENTRSQLLTISSAAGAAAYNLAAAGLVTPNPVTLANQRIGGTALVALTLANSAPAGGFTEGLDASFGALAGSALTNAGAISLLAGGASNNSAMSVGVDTSTAGTRSGSVSVNFASNGAGSSGLGITPLPSQTVNVSGDVYRLANPTALTQSITLAARVGDAAPSASISVTNASPDIFTERLDAALAAIATGFTGSGSVTGLAAGASSSALSVALNTATSGTFTGTANVSLMSSGAGTTGAADFALPSQSVALTGRVYTPAVAQVDTPTIDFGIVHRGDLVAARNVSVTNGAALAGLNDTLQGSLGGAAGPFSATGAFAGLAAQGNDATSLNVSLDTTTAGAFAGTALAAFASQNSELADLVLSSSSIALIGQVNDFAQVALTNSGAGQLSGGGSSYTLDFGSITLGSGDLTADLSVLNAALGPAADLLSGDFDLSGAGAGFALSGFNSFSGLAAGDSLGGLNVVFSSNAAGAFQVSLVLHALGSNASGFIGQLADTTLVLRGSVVAAPEPGAAALLLAGLLGLIGPARARHRRLRHSAT